jgi:branched-chain amino acid transport system substrate-binding protein
MSILLFLMIIPSLALAADSKPNSLDIAVITFFSGSGSVAGGPAVDSAKMTIKQINEAGGIDGVPIKARYIDESGGPTKNVAELREVAHKVDAVVGYISSSDCLAVAPVAENLGVPTIFSACDTSSLFSGHNYKWIFRTQIPDVSDSLEAALYVLKRHPDIKTVAGINQDYAYGHDIWDYFVAAMKALKPDIKIGTSLFPPLFSGHYTSQISRIMAEQPDLLMSQLWGGDLISLIQQGKAQNMFNRTQVAFAVGSLGGVKGFQLMPDGVIVGADQGFLFHPGEIKSKKLKKFVENYKDQFGHYPVGAFPYTLRRAIVALEAGYKQAIKDNGGSWPDKQQLVDALKGLDVKTLLGPMHIRKDHQAAYGGSFGVTMHTSEYPFAVLNHVVKFPLDLIMPPKGTEDKMQWIQSLDPSLLDKVPEPIDYTK